MTNFEKTLLVERYLADAGYPAFHWTQLTQGSVAVKMTPGGRLMAVIVDDDDYFFDLIDIKTAFHKVKYASVKFKLDMEKMLE